jgi:crotonobetainyl-CoA:carnitine CoA-transferase CaiB-like acyl-CoA transferase
MSALNGYKILELAEGVTGEYCGKLLADFGAELIKIERPDGSPTRRLGPFAQELDADDLNRGESSGLFAYLNTGKQSVTLDLDSEQGLQTLQLLLGRVDALIDDHASGWLAQLGLDAATLERRHPRLVACTITPFGLDPLEERTHAEDLTVLHASGWAYHTPTGADPSKPPLKGPGRFLPSYESALDAALCVLAALYERESSGLGRFIDILKQQVMASRVDYVLGQMIAGDMDPSTERSAFDLFGPAGIFECRDGYAYIWMSAPAHWEALRQLLGDPAWMRDFPERWLELACTPERVAECRKHIGAWLRTQSKSEAVAQAQKLGLTMAEVNAPADLLESAQFQHRGFFSSVEHPRLGRLTHPGVPYKLSATPVAISSPAPLLGQHNATQLKGAQA